MSDDNNSKTDVSRHLNFYLDDTKEALVSETTNIEAEVSLYSDTNIKAAVHDAFPVNISLFGTILREDALLTINRISGAALLIAAYQHSAEMDPGQCKLAHPPATKF